MTAPDALDPVLTRPLYSVGEVAALLGLAPATVHSWASRRTRRGADGSARHSVPLVTTTDAESGRSIPFLGLAEAYVLAVLSAAGVSVVRLRPALSYLAREIDPVSPLTSEQLWTAGPAVLAAYDEAAVFAPVLDDAQGQPRFRDGVARYLGQVTYRDERAAAIVLPGRDPAVIVDPRVDDGRPHLAAGEQRSAGRQAPPSR